MAEVGEFAVPIAKRQRLERNVDRPRARGSRLFAPFRTVGLVSSTTVPFTSIPLGKTTFQITTSVGRSLQTYDLRRGLQLVFLSHPQCPENITATCAYRDRVFVAWGGTRPESAANLWVLKRGKLIAELEPPAISGESIENILTFGSWIVGCGSRVIEIWKNDIYEHYTTITPTSSGSNSGDRILSNSICTLPTFLNKIIVGRNDGNIEIYNISTGKLVHTIISPVSNGGAVTALQPTPALGLLAVGYANGSVIICDCESEDVVMSLAPSYGSKPVTSITFRTDGAGAGEDGRKEGVMATASIHSGDVTLWDLNRGGRVVGILRGAHDTSSTSPASGINKIEFLPGQPVLVSTGLDNALKSWIFDQTPFSPIPRILHSRSGHAATPNRVNFLPAASDGSEAAGKWLLSGAEDRSLWTFSLRRDAQSSELSQGSVRHKAKKQGYLSDDTSVETFKASPIIDIACSLNRDGGMGAVNGPVWSNPSNASAEESNMTGWESVVTAHKDDRYARTWSWGRKKAGRWTFETGDKKPVTSVAITACGTFALVGSAGGSLDMFNLQSGIHRQRFPPRLKPSQAKRLRMEQIQSDQLTIVPRGHRDVVTGIVVDNLNQTVISTGLDDQLIFWDFVTGSIITTLSFNGAAPTAISYNSTSGLVALACEDFYIRVVDIETKRVVRELRGCTDRIYDHCFSHDGRWIVAASMDSVVRVFDLATGHLIDAFRTATCTNVSFSSTGEFLATTHVGSIGINIWTNKSLYSNIPSKQISEDKGIIDLTDSVDYEAAHQILDDEDMSEDEEVIGVGNDTSDIDQLDASLLTLSLMPQSRWQTLLNLDAVRERNKSIQPPEKPKAAPFFLGSSLTNGTRQDTQELVVANDTSLENERSRISKLASLTSTQSPVSSLLDTFTHSHNPVQLTAYLTTLSPSITDLEIRSLTLSEMPTFVRALTAQLHLRKDFELVNTWMSVFLRVHGDFISEVEDISQAVLEWKNVMVEEERRLGRLVGFTKGVVEFLRSAR